MLKSVLKLSLNDQYNFLLINLINLNLLTTFIILYYFSQLIHIFQNIILYQIIMF